MPIRTKLAIGFSLLAAVVLISMATARYIGQKELLLDNKDFSLKVTAGLLAGLLPRVSPSPAAVEKTVNQMISSYPEIRMNGLTIDLYDPGRELLFSSSGKGERSLSFQPGMWENAIRDKTALFTLPSPTGKGRVRVFMKAVRDSGNLLYVIRLGGSMDGIDMVLKNFLVLNIVFVPITALLLGAGGWWLTRVNLAPLEDLIGSARRISSGDFGYRIPPGNRGREIENLSAAINGMCGHIEDSFRQIREFTENVSHELKIPLSILRGETELALRRPRTPDEYRGVLESSLEEITRMEKIVERLLFLARAERGETEVLREPFDLAKLREEVMGRLNRKAEEKGIRMAGGDAGPAWIRGDPHLLREVLFNLLQNALNHTPPGGRIETSIRKRNNRIELSVRDTGTGIPAESLPHIFERFYQADKSHSAQGSGLGLSIVQAITRAHGGSVSVESRLGEGSCFTVSLPLNGKSDPD